MPPPAMSGCRRTLTSRLGTSSTVVPSGSVMSRPPTTMGVGRSAIRSKSRRGFQRMDAEVELALHLGQDAVHDLGHPLALDEEDGGQHDHRQEGDQPGQQVGQDLEDFPTQVPSEYPDRARPAKLTNASGACRLRPPAASSAGGFGNPPRVRHRSRWRRRASPAGARAREGLGTLPGFPSQSAMAEATFPPRNPTKGHGLDLRRQPALASPLRRLQRLRSRRPGVLRSLRPHGSADHAGLPYLRHAA